MPKYDEEMKSMDKDKLTASLNRQKEEKMKIYQERGYSEEVLTTLFDRTFSVEEFLTNDRKIVQAELEDAVLRTEYGSFIAIGDIVDAIYGGKYRSNELVNQYGNAVGHAYGHGISYYSRGVELGFDETMANFSSIAKSKDANEVLGYLRNMFGDRFVNFIGNFYYNQVSRSTKDLTPQEEEKKASDML